MARTATRTGAVRLLVTALALGSVLVVAAPRAGAQIKPPDTMDPGDVTRRTIEVRAEAAEETQGRRIVDRLAPTTLLTIEAMGFDRDTTGSIRQCTTGEARSCRNHLAVRFDDRGRATFQYLVDDGGGCRLADDRCTVELFVGDRETVIDTVFVDAAPPPGVITVSPDDELQPGDRVEVRATGFPAGSRLVATVCIAPAISGPRCGSPAPEVAFDTDESGTGVAVLELDVDEVGEALGACGRRSRCQVVVADATGTGRPRQSAAPIALGFAPIALSFEATPGATYDGPRVVIGITASLVLLFAAGWIIAREDWRPPDESDGSAIDDAEYADLDLEAERHEVEGDMIDRYGVFTHTQS